VEAAPDALLVVNDAGRIMLANRQCEVLFGWAAADLVGRPLEALIPQSLRDAYGERWAAYLADPRTRSTTAGTGVSALRVDGAEVPVDIGLSPVETPAGFAVILSVRDATPRREMERELQASEERWKTSLAGMLDGFAILRSVREQGEIVDFEFVYVNQAAAVTYRRSAEELVGATVRAVLPGFESSGRFDDYKRVVETGRPLTTLDHRYSDETVSGIFDTQAWKLDDGFAVSWRDVSDREASALALRTSEERFRACVETLPDALSIFTAVRQDSGEIVDFRWDYANVAASAMTGYPPGELPGRRLLEVLPDHRPSGMFDVYKRVVETGEPFHEPSLWYEDVWGDGTRQVRATRVQDGFVVVTREVTGQRKQQEAVARQQAELERTNREIRLLNELAEFLQGCPTPEEAYSVVAGSSERLFPGCGGFLSIMQPSRDLLEMAAAWGEAAGKEAVTVFAPGDCWALRRGRPHLSGGAEPRCPHFRDSAAAWCLCVPMIGQSEPIGVFHVLSAARAEPGSGSAAVPDWIQPLASTVSGQVSMAAANLKLRDTLRNLSIRDPLTGLFNRRYMEETLAREVSRSKRTSSPLAVLQLDIDYFKQFNDAYGHEAGGAVMKAVADILMRMFRDSDVACRYGGEEFTLILPDCPLDTAEARAEELRARLSRLDISYEGSDLAAPTMSCGIAVYPEHGAAPGTLLRVADAALYAAKAAGRDRVVRAPVRGTGDATAPQPPSP
jgi:diguanylate cyclase (GGDEF)-like protein/PAS domain S-box-containing protein